jgi:uncharacterized protein YciI
MLFVVNNIDKSGALALRMETREAHFAYIHETGVLRLGGPLLDDKGDMAGSLMIIDVADLETAKAWVANDPYAKAGLFQSSDVRAWKATANLCEARL